MWEGGDRMDLLEREFLDGRFSMKETVPSLVDL